MMPTENTYKQGMRVWIPHPMKVWQSAIIIEDYEANQNKLYVQADDSRETKILNVNSSAELPPLHLSEDSSLDIKSNLSSLTVIHEATILQKLRSRFEQRQSYSYCGITTIALNPYFESCENEKDKILSYRESNLKNLNPHVFGVAENVYTKLERENCDQTVVFTGESGAGKSVNAERAILYLTTISSKDNHVREKILASSVILQAFGHSTTEVHNDSSRFGKFVQMQYDKNYHVIGALLTTYNLDRSKIVSQGLLGNIFNIFYYMYGAKEDLSYLQLDDCQFDYLKKRTDVEAYNVHNRKCFDTIIQAFNVLEFSEKEKSDVLNTLAVLLHLQSLAFKKSEAAGINGCTVADPNRLNTITKILDLDEKAQKNMRKWMCHKRTFFEKDEILQPMSLVQAMKARDALAKFIYTKLFDWLVTWINASLRSPCRVQSFIGILDMQGFEKLDSNSLEQCCINYIDEKIQQLFIQSNFKLEQAEYIHEQIGWTPIGFSDNISCVDLMEGQRGIFDLLDEETKLSTEDNVSWLENLHTKFDKTQNFEKSEGNKANFIIHHFIHPVQYDATDFLTKNYEGVSKEQFEVLKETKNELLSKFFADDASKPNVTKVKRKISINRRSSFSSKSRKKTVASELRASLAALCATLNQTKICFVRCIKSNDEKKPLTFDSQCVVEQLRAFSICDTIKISAAGYFQQRCYKEFVHRYHCLCEFEDVKREDKREVCQKILSAYREHANVKFGETKVFLREDTVNDLENLRADKRRYASITIQKSIRRFLQQKRYNETRRTVYEIQRYARGFLIRGQMQAIRDKMRMHAAATKIQACFRGHLEYRWFQYVKHNLPIPQAYAQSVRQHFGRFYTKDMAATEIQKHVKSFLARRSYERTLKKIIIVQSFARRFLAMMQLKKLKYQNNLRPSLLNKSLEQKLDFLQERIDCLMTMHLSSDDLQAVNSMVDTQTCVQTKNRILNELLFKKIRNLQDLRTNEKHCEIPQIQNPQPDTTSANQPCGINWRTFDKPMVEQYDNKELYRKLYEGFQKADRDAKTLQQTAGIEDSELLSLMESYRNSIRATKIPEISISNHTEQKDHSKNDEGLTKPHPGKVDHRISNSHQSANQRVQSVTLDTKDLQAVNPYALPEEETLDPHEECLQRFAKKAYRLAILTFDDDTSEEDPIPDVKSQDLNQYSSPKIENQQIALPLPDLKNDQNPNKKLKAAKRFRLIMYGHEEDSPEEATINNVIHHGMFQFDLKTTHHVIHQLTDISPSTFTEYGLSLDLPAQILMKCIRYTDRRDEYVSALSLIHNFIRSVKNIVDTHRSFDIRVFWLLNTYKLLNYLKQYSIRHKKNDQYHLENTDRQNDQRLWKIDLCDTWITLENTCGYIANCIIQEMKSCNLALYSVKGLLYAESIYKQKEREKNEEEKKEKKGETKEKQVEAEEIKPTVDILLNELTFYYDSFVKYSVDRQIVIQVFKPIFNYITSVTFNHILFYSNLCSISRSIQIRYNLIELERWVIDRQLSLLIPLLHPIIQAVRFIQLQPMSQIDIINIQKKYDELKHNQMLRLVELYNTYCASEMPANYDKVSVSPEIINTLKEKIEHGDDLDDTISLEPDEYLIEIPFQHSKVKLEKVEIPQRMNLPMLSRF